MNVRTLLADEIECRVQTVKENGCSVLLYKDARCDMRILDETFGIGNWQRSHEVINGNLFCNVGIRFDRETGFGEWVWKQDVGTESFTEKEKGQASDSFKRACFNWGIGRELYTAPFIWISLNSGETYKGNKGNLIVKTKFYVSKIQYNDKKEIVALEIKDDEGKVRYKSGQMITTEVPEETPIEKAEHNYSKDTVIPFGKHKSKTIGEVLVEDRPYIEWLSQKAKETGMRKFCTDLLLEHPDPNEGYSDEMIMS